MKVRATENIKEGDFIRIGVLNRTAQPIKSITGCWAHELAVAARDISENEAIDFEATRNTDDLLVEKFVSRPRFVARGC